MRLESALYASREGVTTHGKAIAVVGDNVSNANTIGFKKSRVEFADLMADGRDGHQSESEPSSGSGVAVATVRQMHQSGIVEFTGRSLDAGIEGNGLFLVGDAANPSFTRAGNFSLSADGELVTVDGLNVLGYAPGGSSLSPLKLDNINLTGSQTTASTIYGNLNSGVETTTLPVAPQSFNEVAAVASFVASDINVYDSLGAQHALNIAFFKLGPNQWTARAYIDGADVGGVAGQPVQVGADATLAFSSSGSITEQSAAAAVITAQPAYSGGAAAGNFTIDLSSFSQYASSSLVNAVTQDGIGVGSIEEYSIEKTGELYANLSGGTRQLIGTIPLAMFTNIDGLDRVGGTLYRNGATVGTISVGTAGDDGRGTIQGAALERSAVDIGEEFTELVLLQRGYQANSQMLNAASGMIKDTIGLML